MSGDLNDLTKRLYAEGWTRENHPGNVYWGDFQNLEYRWEWLSLLTWKTQCGLYVCVYDISSGGTSFNGVTYCPENNNPVVHCPFSFRQCPAIPDGFKFPECPCHETGETYDTDYSFKHYQDLQDKEKRGHYIEIVGGEQYCACVHFKDDGSNLADVRYDVEQCIRMGCQNEFCAIREKPRDLSKTNIFYDIRRTWITRIGLIEDKRVEVTKGEKVFKSPISRTDAEIWLKVKQAEFDPLRSKSIINPHISPDDRRMAYFSKHHRQWPGYDYFEFYYEAENIRIEARERRDLLQDLQDVEEGIEVVHVSDTIKAAKAQKTERRAAAKEKRDQRLEKRLLVKGWDGLELLDKGRIEKYIDEDRIDEIEEQHRQLAENAEPVFEQTSLF